MPSVQACPGLRASARALGEDVVALFLQPAVSELLGPGYASQTKAAEGSQRAMDFRAQLVSRWR
jgi:hypothetical protein